MCLTMRVLILKSKATKISLLSSKNMMEHPFLVMFDTYKLYQHKEEHYYRFKGTVL
jgi:hypothetical protein